MAVTFDAQSTAATTGDAVTTHNHTNLTVGAGSNRALVVCLKLGGSTLPTGVNVTWDQGGTNQAMSLITNTNVNFSSGGNASTLYLYGIIAPTSGNKTLRIAWTNIGNIHVTAAAFTGVDQTGGSTSFPNGITNTGTSATSSVTVTSATGDYVAAIHGIDAGDYQSVNQTQIAISNGPPATNMAANRAAGAASVNLTATCNASGAWAAAGSSIKAATAGTTDGAGNATGTGTSTAIGTPIATLAPDADVTDGGWLTDTGGTNLFAAIDEVPASDTDYIVSSDTDTDTCEIRLSDPSTTVARPFSVAYRYKRIGSDDITLRVALMEGATQRASWDTAVSSGSFTSAEQFLTAPEFAAITDLTDLRVRFTAIRAAEDVLTLEGDFSGDLTLEGDFSGSLLLEGT